MPRRTCLRVESHLLGRLLGPTDRAPQNLRYAAAAGYTPNSPESGTYTIKITGIPAVVTLPKGHLKPDSPSPMKDRIPPRVNTMIQVTVSNVSASSPVTLESVGAPRSRSTVRPPIKLTSPLMGRTIPCCRRPHKRPAASVRIHIEALQGGQLLAKTAPFAVSAIPYNYTDAFKSEIGGRARGIVVKDGWRSD